jgi:hypothetical protein
LPPVGLPLGKFGPRLAAVYVALERTSIGVVTYVNRVERSYAIECANFRTPLHAWLGRRGRFEWMSGRDVLKNHCAEIRISKDPAHIIKTTPSATAAIRSATLHRLQSDLMSGIISAHDQVLDLRQPRPWFGLLSAARTMRAEPESLSDRRVY